MSRPSRRELVEHRKLHTPGSTLRSVILGGQDGIVNILGMVLGLSAASGSVRLVIAAGLATTFAESLSMAAVAYTSTLADRDFYRSQVERERDHISRFPEIEREEIRQVYLAKGFVGKQLDEIVDAITSDDERWVEVMLKEEFGLSPVEGSGVLKTAAIVGCAAVLGSLIPLIPFFGLPINWAVWAALALTGVSLFVVGVVKARLTVGDWWKSGLLLSGIGMVTALVSYWIGLWVMR